MSTRARARFFQTVVPPASTTDSDWIARSAGAVVAKRLETSTEVSDYTFVDATSDHISFESSLHAPGALGSAKFSVLNTDGAACGQMSVPFGTTFGNGSLFWVSFRQMQPATHLYAPWPTGTGSQAHKQAIVSRDANGASPIGSNQVNEIVWQHNHNTAQTSAYDRDGSGSGSDFAAFEVAFSSPLNASDFRAQPEIDRGANPLTGNNPDTGAAWSSADQTRARYGLTYGARSTPGVANFVRGLGDPFSGGFRPRPGEWATFTLRIEVGTFGTASSRVSGWAAHEDEAPELLFDMQNEELGAGPDYNAINPLPYTTGRVAGGRQISSRTNNITGCTIHVCGLSTPIGDGTLEYVASTQRFRWSGFGESFGTARGFSAANDILTIPVIAGTNSYLVIEVDPALLPSSGTTTDTVTIADGRGDKATYYNDVIVKSGASPILFPGGFVPQGVSELEDLAASLAPNAWGSITSSSLTQSLITRGDSDSIISYCKNGQWDPIGRRIYFWGSTHGTMHLKRLLRYIPVSNVWETDQDGAPESDGSNSHGYWHFAIRPSDGQQFHRHYGSASVSTRAAGGSWSAAASLPGTVFFDWNVGNAMCWHPGLNSGAGGLVFAGQRTVYGSNAAVSSWSQLHSVAGLNGDYHNAICRSAVDNLVYFGGGNGSTNFWRVNANGTVTARAALPFSVGADGASGQGGLFGGATGNIVAISSAGSIREFDDATNTWSAEISTLPFSPDQETYFGVTIPELGVIVFVWISSGLTPSTSMYVWKH